MNCFQTISFFVLILSNSVLFGQNEFDFQSPVQHNIVLSGSFGELRSTHFHAGLDIKPTQPDSPDEILCVELGYISRIKIKRSGYGRAIYIDHPNGYTSVYAHLSTFTPKIQEYVEQIQRSAQSYEIEIFPTPGEFLIQKGDVIGLLGNSGRSYGPHLHFEIRKTETEHPVNPMLFGIGPQDDIAPILTSLLIHGLNPKKQAEQKLYYDQGKIPNSIYVNAWRAGIGISGYDLMNGASNKNGIYRLTLFVDDSLYYQQTMKEVSFEEMNQIKAHIDYQTKIDKKRTYALTYRLPGNNLSIIDSIRNDGIIKLFKETPRSIRIEALDLSGNLSTISTQLYRKESVEKSQPKSYNLSVKYQEPVDFQVNPIRLKIPAFSLSNDETLIIENQLKNGIKIYHIGEENIPLLQSAALTIQLDSVDKNNSEKLLLVKIEDGKFIDYGTIVKPNSITSYIGSFGNFRLYTDTIPPTIKPLHFPASSGDAYTFTLKDDVLTKGMAQDFEYDVYINDQWFACEYKELNNILYIPKSICNPTDNIKIIVVDQNGNEAIWEN